MKTIDLKNKDQKELLNLLKELRGRMAKLVFDLEANSLKDTSQIQKTKRDIARVLTMLKQIK
jgi:large subunit ribosomal protein L29